MIIRSIYKEILNDMAIGSLLSTFTNSLYVRGMIIK